MNRINRSKGVFVRHADISDECTHSVLRRIRTAVKRKNRLLHGGGLVNIIASKNISTVDHIDIRSTENKLTKMCRELTCNFV